MLGDALCYSCTYTNYTIRTTAATSSNLLTIIDCTGASGPRGPGRAWLRGGNVHIYNSLVVNQILGMKSTYLVVQEGIINGLI